MTALHPNNSVNNFDRESSVESRKRCAVAVAAAAAAADDDEDDDDDDDDDDLAVVVVADTSLPKSLGRCNAYLIPKCL